MLFEITYEINYRGLKNIIERIESLFNKGELSEGSSLIKAVEGAGTDFVQYWIGIANSKFRHSQGGYVEGIYNGISYPHDGDPLVYKITHQEERAYYLEEGTDSFDMKKMLDTSHQVRVTKDGKRYLIIPFRHGTPGAKSNPMPKDVYKEAKQLKHSYPAGQFNEGSIKGFVSMKDADLLREINPTKAMRRSYEWGERLQSVSGKRLDDNSIYKNMVRFQQNTNILREKFNFGKFGGDLVNSTENMGDYSSYITFRVMVEGSAKWIHPGIKPMKILDETVRTYEGQIMQTLVLGAQEDMVRALELRGQGLI